MNDCIRLAVACGARLEDALVLATANPAQYHNFQHLGWLAPGTQQAGTTPDQRLCLLRPAARGQRYPERQRDRAAGLLSAVLPGEFRGTLGTAPSTTRPCSATSRPD